MNATTYRRTVEVTIEDEETGTARRVPVDLTYLVEVDHNYGADADGRRGQRREEVYILDQAIAEPILRHLTIDQVVYVIDRAIQAVTEGVTR